MNLLKGKLYENGDLNMHIYFEVEIVFLKQFEN